MTIYLDVNSRIEIYIMVNNLNYTIKFYYLVVRA